MRVALIAVLLLGFATAPVSAVTLDEIVALSRAGVADAVLLALIDRDKSVFAIEAPQIVTLKEAGISEAVILAMLKSGRVPPGETVPAQPPVAGPEVIIVGHGPERPNVARHDPEVFVSLVPIIAPYMVVILPSPSVRTGCVAHTLPSTEPRLGVPPYVGRRANVQRAPAIMDCEPIPRGRHRSRR